MYLLRMPSWPLPPIFSLVFQKLFGSNGRDLDGDKYSRKLELTGTTKCFGLKIVMGKLSIRGAVLGKVGLTAQFLAYCAHSRMHILLVLVRSF